MDCFSSADPDAVNSTLLYDHNNDVDNLWFRNDTAGPLKSCFPPRPRHFQCTVCLHDDQDVYAMCRNLTDKAKIVMEAVGKSVNIIKSDCPTPPAPPEDAQQWLQPGIIILIIIGVLFIILIIIGVLFYRKCCKNRNEMQNNPQEVTEMRVMTAEADVENHTPPLLMNGINNGSQQHAGIQQV